MLATPTALSKRKEKCLCSPLPCGLPGAPVTESPPGASRQRRSLSSESPGLSGMEHRRRSLELRDQSFRTDIQKLFLSILKNRG